MWQYTNNRCLEVSSRSGLIQCLLSWFGMHHFNSNTVILWLTYRNIKFPSNKFLSSLSILFSQLVIPIPYFNLALQPPQLYPAISNPNLICHSGLEPESALWDSSKMPFISIIPYYRMTEIYHSYNHTLCHFPIKTRIDFVGILRIRHSCKQEILTKMTKDGTAAGLKTLEFDKF